MKPRDRLAVLAILPALAATSVARAQDTSDLQQLLSETVITTASKSAETGTAAPATSTTITADDLHRYGIRSLDEALDFLSLGVWTSSNLTNTDTGARGVILPQDQGSHFLLLIDGHAVNEPLFGTARIDRGVGVPLEMVDHIEVILGPGSVLYGSNAMLGVINVITKRAKDWKGGHVVGEWEAGKSARAAAGVGWVIGQSTELTFMGEYYRRYGPNLTLPTEFAGQDTTSLRGYGFHPNGPYDGVWGGPTTHTPRADSPSGILRLSSGNFDVEAGGKIYRRQDPFNQQDLGAYAFIDDPDAYQTDRQLWVDIKHRATLSAVLQLTSRLYGDSYDYQRTADTSFGNECLPYGVTQCRSDLVGVSRWAGLEEQLSVDWLKDASLVTLIGADGRARYVASKTDKLDYAAFTQGRTVYVRSSDGVINYSDQILGAYAQQTWRATRWLGVNGGARLDVDPRFAPQVSPRLAATVRPWAGGTFKAILAEAFRAPSIGESLSYGSDQIPAHDLHPETEVSAEASLEQKLAGSHKMTFGAFRTAWSDLIQYHSLSQTEIQAALKAGLIPLVSASEVVQYRNVSSIHTYGFEWRTEGASSSNAFRYAVNVTGAMSTYDDGLTSHPLAVAPNLFGNAQGSYDLPGEWPTVALATRFIGRRPSDEAFGSGFQPAPYAPPLFGLRGTVSGDVPFVPTLSYRLSLDWTTSGPGPYVIGPEQNASLNGSLPANDYVMAPNADRFRVSLGLQWDFAQ